MGMGLRGLKCKTCKRWGVEEEKKRAKDRLW